MKEVDVKYFFLSKRSIDFYILFGLDNLTRVRGKSLSCNPKKHWLLLSIGWTKIIRRKAAISPKCTSCLIYIMKTARLKLEIMKTGWELGDWGTIPGLDKTLDWICPIINHFHEIVVRKHDWKIISFFID